MCWFFISRKNKKIKRQHKLNGTIYENYTDEEFNKKKKEVAMLKTIEKGHCPDCNARHSFSEGPSGGMSTNIVCQKCHSKFNICPGFFVERL